MTLDPSMEATFCDWLKGLDEPPDNPTKQEVYTYYNDFLSKYHVYNEEFLFKLFYEFVDEVVCGERCEKCGEKSFPYFIPGQAECIKCLT